MMKRFTNVFKSESGFTLVELLVVIAVLAILAAVAVPRLSGVRDRAYEAEAQHALDAFKTGLEMYRAENQTYPTDGSDFDDMANQYLPDDYDDTDPANVSNPVGTYITDWEVGYDGDGGDVFTVTMQQDINGNTVTVELEHTASGYTKP